MNVTDESLGKPSETSDHGKAEKANRECLLTDEQESAIAGRQGEFPFDELGVDETREIRLTLFFIDMQLFLNDWYSVVKESDDVWLAETKNYLILGMLLNLYEDMDKLLTEKWEGFEDLKGGIAMLREFKADTKRRLEAWK